MRTVSIQGYLKKHKHVVNIYCATHVYDLSASLYAYCLWLHSAFGIYADVFYTLSEKIAHFSAVRLHIAFELESN